jgi:ribose transport system substrate-binding protein
MSAMIQRRQVLQAGLSGFIAVWGMRADLAHADQSFTVGYSQFWGTNPFLVSMANGAKKAIAEWKAKGVNVNMILTNGGDTDTTKQVSDLEDLEAQGVQGLLLFPGDSSILAEPVKNIYNKKDIPVVVTDIGLQSGKWVTLLISDNYGGGKQAAELLAKNVKPGASVIIFDHAPGVNGAQTRARGFEDTAKKLGLVLLPRKTLKLNLEEARRTMEDTLASNPEVAGMFSMGALVPEGAYTALEAAKRTDVQLVNFDVDAVSFQMIKDGKILGSIIQDPFKIGYEGMNAMVLKLTGGNPPARIDLPTYIVTKENADQFANDPQITGVN